MEIITTLSTDPTPRTFRLREEFLAPYRTKGDLFPTLLARCTYATKYCRDGETWTDTIRRVVEGNVNLAPGVHEKEAEALFDHFWRGEALPPGRGLWTGGVAGIPADARFNCWYTTLYGIDDWCWAMNQLMLGGGVGIGLSDIGKLPAVTASAARLSIHCGASHPNLDEVKPNEKAYLNGSTPIFRVEDSREGWVEAFRRVMQAAFQGQDLIVDVTAVRPRGLPIRTFGGTACGPGPLTHLLRATWAIVRGAQGRQLTSVECLDITNYVGFCVKSGNVRRSALIVLGQATDQAFRDAKKDFDAVISHRHTSNNSIVFRTNEEIATFDWEGLVEDNVVYGEPGLLNLAKIRETDPGAMGVNPCGEQALHDREACNLAEVFPALFRDTTDAEHVFRLTLRYCLRQRLTPLTDAQSHKVGLANMRVGVGLGGLCDFSWTPEMLAGWFTTTRAEANEYAAELGVARPLTVTTVKPSGTISLLNGSSPGIHAPYAPFYIRRSRLAKNDPMVPALIAANVPCEPDQYDQTGNTLVFSFPMKARHNRISVQTETIADQFKRQADVQRHWADNAVSATLSFDPNTEKAETAALLRRYIPEFKSTSMLAKSGHGYVQAPYEAIDEQAYRDMAAPIDLGAQLGRGGEMEIDECVGGACPVR